jgi:hypothetical protein
MSISVPIQVNMAPNKKQQIENRAKTHGTSMTKTLLDSFDVYNALLGGNFKIMDGKVLVISSINQSFEAKACQT